MKKLFIGILFAIGVWFTGFGAHANGENRLGLGIFVIFGLVSLVCSLIFVAMAVSKTEEKLPYYQQEHMEGGELFFVDGVSHTDRRYVILTKGNQDDKRVLCFRDRELP